MNEFQLTHEGDVGMALVAIQGNSIKRIYITVLDGHKGHPYITFVRIFNSTGVV